VTELELEVVLEVELIELELEEGAVHPAGILGITRTESNNHSIVVLSPQTNRNSKIV
jgi:hypothetical protein